ncbi:hypothetical protein ACH4VR_25775 [Streptomyces sp. NPDC020883]
MPRTTSMRPSEVVIRVIEERDGRERVLTAWEHGRVVEAPQDST